jgi:DNA-binding Lrp family transcriptional regulator
MADVAERIFTPLEQRLLNEFQRDFPTTPRPYAEIAVRLGTDEDTVIETYTRLLQENAISRIGVTVAPRRAGASTLAAMSVPDNRLGEVANIVSGYREVNHNYERDHEMNLWFVVTAPSTDRIPEVLSDIRNRTGIDVLEFPLEEAYRLDLGFDLKWT